MLAVIVQPLYLPWIGYFDLIDRSDVFVFLDDVQFKGRSWQQRNRIKTHSGDAWLTVPVINKYLQKINEVHIDNSQNWMRKHWESIKHAYSKAAHFNDFSGFYETIYGQKNDSLMDLNVGVIKHVSEQLGIGNKFILSSELGVEEYKTDRLINICKKVEATRYLSGPAARSYLQEDKFRENGIEVVWHEYEHPIYRQLNGEFIPYMSVIDLLLNEGDTSLNIIRSGRRNA
jgi:hypothetical protein